MNLKTVCIPHLSILWVRFETSDRWTLILYHLHSRKGRPSIIRHETLDENAPWPEANVYPVLVLCGGHGVIVKESETATDLIARVCNQNDRFRWSRYPDSSGEHFAFAQRTQLLPLEEWLQDVPVVDLQLSALPNPDQQSRATLERADRFYRPELSWKMFLKPSAQSTILANGIVSRLRLPVLGLLLLLLIGNYLLSDHLTAQKQQWQQQVDIARTRLGQQERLSDQKQQLWQDFNRLPEIPYALICDRIAEAVPADISLTELSVQPLQKKLEEHKTLALDERIITLKGMAIQADEITEFAQRLQQNPLIQTLTLIRLEQETETPFFRFHIRMSL